MDINVSKKVLKALSMRDERAFEIVLEEYRCLVYGIIYKMIFDKQKAEDLMIDVFQIVWDKCEQIDYNTGNFHSWIITITYNIVKNYFREKKTKENYDILPYDDEVFDVCDDANSILDSILFHDLKKILSEEEYTIIVFKVVFNNTFAFISEKINVPETSVRRYYENARCKVKRYLKGNKDEKR